MATRRALGRTRALLSLPVERACLVLRWQQIVGRGRRQRRMEFRRSTKHSDVVCLFFTGIVLMEWHWGIVPGARLWNDPTRLKRPSVREIFTSSLSWQPSGVRHEWLTQLEIRETKVWFSRGHPSRKDGRPSLTANEATLPTFTLSHPSLPSHRCLNCSAPAGFEFTV